MAAGPAAGMADARIAQVAQVFSVQGEVCSVQLLGELGRAQAVLGIAAIAEPAGIVEEGEQFDHIEIRASLPGQLEAIVPHPGPVIGAMDAVPIQLEARLDLED